MHSTVAVAVPAYSLDLTTLEKIKLELGITDDSEDLKLAGWIRQASQIAASYCRRVFGQEEVAETFRPGPGRRNGCATARDFLALARYPVVSITAVTEDGTTVVLPDYDLDAENGFLYRASGATPSEWSFSSSIVVDYVGGYDLPDGVPADLERAVMSMCSDLRADATRDPNLIEKEIVGVSRYRWWVPSDAKTMLPPAVSGLLDPYVRKQGMDEMTDPLKERAELDAALADCGTDIEIQRLVAGTLASSVVCKAFVTRDRINDELVGGIVQRNLAVIMSPTQIIADGWPDPDSSVAIDQRVPLKGDKVVNEGRVMNIEESYAKYIDNELVRIELRVKG